MSTRFRDGSVTVTLDEGMERFVRGLLSAAETETVATLEAEATIVADYAREQWYRRVERETGQSGDIGTVTTIDGARGEVRVSVGSRDPRKDKRGRPAVAFVRAPGPLSLVLKRVDHKQYWATPAGMRHKYPFILEPNPAASDGSYLLQTLIRTPMKRRVKAMAAGLASQIVARASGA